MWYIRVLYFHNCCQDNVWYFNAEVKDCEFFVIFYIYILQIAWWCRHYKAEVCSCVVKQSSFIKNCSEWCIARCTLICVGRNTLNVLLLFLVSLVCWMYLYIVLLVTDKLQWHWPVHCHKCDEVDERLNFRHRASCILGQAFHYSPENAFYLFNLQIYFIIWYLFDRASLI